MQDRRLVAAGAALALVVVAVVAFTLIAPRIAARGLDGLVQAQLGRSLGLRGGAHLDFSPLSLRLDDVALSGPAAADDSFITARSAVIPVTPGQLFGAAPQVSRLSLAEADVALLIDERGQASWDFPGAAAGALTVTLEQARLRYFDARNSQSMELAQVDGTLDIRADGGVSFAGTAVINKRLVRIDADLKSLARVNADGSPLELALAADDGTANFSGRLSTAQVLSLAGPISLSGTATAPALRLLGLPIPNDMALAGPIAVDGALDTAGRALAIRNATLSVGAFRAEGDLGADLRNERPKLQANLTADALWLDPVVPASGAANGDWGRRPLPFALLKALDIEAAVEAKSLAYGGVTAGPSSLKVTLADGKLEVVDASRLGDEGTLNLTVKADAGAVPPSVGVSLEVNDAPAQPLVATLTGATGFTGTGGFSADLTAAGTTQEELAGTLKGSVSMDYVNGSIAGVDLTGLVLASKHKILEGWQQAPGGTPFTSLAGEAKVEDGIASFRDFRIEGPTSFTLEGLVDVLRQGLAISAHATANGLPLLPVAVIAKGLWAKPKIYPDVPNILGNPEGGFAKLQEGN